MLGNDVDAVNYLIRSAATRGRRLERLNVRPEDMGERERAWYNRGRLALGLTTAGAATTTLGLGSFARLYNDAKRSAGGPIALDPVTQKRAWPKNTAETRMLSRHGKLLGRIAAVGALATGAGLLGAYIAKRQQGAAATRERGTPPMRAK